MTDSALHPSQPVPPSYGRFKAEASSTYLTPPEVEEIVNLAIHLSRPILVEGEAGCGKTRLAHAIAEGLGLASSMVTTTVKSTSQARDLLYRFDALRRLQDAQDPANSAAREVWPYIHLQPLGKALRMGKPCVVLIDEIDKADIDFPNDLLDVLDSFQFEIEDLPDEENERSEASKGFGRLVKTHPGGVRPIVVITSNREKPLPEPFLRRCLYIQLGFPSDAGTLMEIVKRNLGRGVERMNESLIERAITEFLSVRSRSEDRNLQKPPGTSELVDWVRALHWQGRATNTIAADALTPSDKAVLLKLQRDLESWKRSPDSDVPA